MVQLVVTSFLPLYLYPTGQKWHNFRFSSGVHCSGVHCSGCPHANHEAMAGWQSKMDCKHDSRSMPTPRIRQAATCTQFEDDAFMRRKGSLPRDCSSPTHSRNLGGLNFIQHDLGLRISPGGYMQAIAEAKVKARRRISANEVHYLDDLAR